MKKPRFEFPRGLVPLWTALEKVGVLWTGPGDPGVLRSALRELDTFWVGRGDTGVLRSAMRELDTVWTGLPTNFPRPRALQTKQSLELYLLGKGNSRLQFGHLRSCPAICSTPLRLSFKNDHLGRATISPPAIGRQESSDALPWKDITTAMKLVSWQ